MIMNKLLSYKRECPFMYIIGNAVFILYLGVVAYQNIFCSYNPSLFPYYGYTEFLINFEGGFVRRGLIGELLFYLCRATGVSPFVIIYGVCVGAWIIVMTFFLYKFKKNNWMWWILMSPIFLGATYNMIRKDYLLYVIIILIFYLLSKRYNPINLIGVLLLACFGIMVHEAFIFYGIPIMSLFLISQKKTRLSGILIAAICMSLFVLLCVYKGNANVADAIYNSWNTILADGELVRTPNNSIAAIGWETTNAFKAHLKFNFTSMEFGKFTIVPRIFMSVLAYYLFTNFLSAFRKGGQEERAILIKKRISILYVVSFVCLLPMFTVLSCDYGRVYQYLLVSTFSALLLLPGEKIDGLLPEKLTHQILRFNNLLGRAISANKPTKGLLLFLLLFVSVTPYYFSVNEAVGYSLFYALCRLPYSLINIINELPIH